MTPRWLWLTSACRSLSAPSKGKEIESDYSRWDSSASSYRPSSRHFFSHKQFPISEVSLMYAAHFATGLALKSYVPKSPTWAVLAGAFLPDLLWIALARVGVEPTAREIFFDDWSHSFFTIVLWATLFALLFWRLGWLVVLAVWVAVFSHFPLDAVIHPKHMALYPHSRIHIGWIASGGVFALKNWSVELAIVVVMSIVYGIGAKRNALPVNLIVATLTLLLGLELLDLP